MKKRDFLEFRIAEDSERLVSVMQIYKKNVIVKDGLI
jgi:hypothetical protein